MTAMGKLAGILAAIVAFGTFATGALAESETGERETAGSQLFAQRCAACHDERGFGTRVLSRRLSEDQAELKQRSGLSHAFVIAVVRRGIGSMPQIREAELSDADLRSIAAYLEGSE